MIRAVTNFSSRRGIAKRGEGGGGGEEEEGYAGNSVALRNKRNETTCTSGRTKFLSGIAITGTYASHVRPYTIPLFVDE